MNWLKRNYGWIIVTILAALPLLVIKSMLLFDMSNGVSISLIEDTVGAERTTLEMLYHVSGEFAIRWMTAVLTCTPFYIIFGVNNLFVRQSMGIATAIWSLLHFIIFIAAEGFTETFKQFNYVLGFIAILILIALLLTSNRKSMKKLKKNWKKLQTLSYAAILLSLIHVAKLDKTWIIYAVIVGVGFIIRIPIFKNKFIDFRNNKKLKTV